MNDRNPSSGPKDAREQLKERILTDYPRLGPDDSFRFACHPGIGCFNQCCRDVNIFLAPYDVLRMKRRLGMSSSEFLKTHTIMPVQKDMKTPVVMLRMQDDEAKSCPFVSQKGCSIYSDRPWPCRMFPLGLATQKDAADGWCGERFYFLMPEEGCQGFAESKKWTVGQWLENQELDDYDEWGEAFKELTLHDWFAKGDALSPEKLHMMFTATYDLDKFRSFVFESTLLARFDVDEGFVEEMRGDDEGLLRFAFLWLRFSLFGEKTVKVKPNVLEAFKGNLEKDKLFHSEPA